MESLLSLSKLATVSILHASEWAVVIFGFVFLAGWIAEEVTKSERLKKYHWVFLTLAIFGVGGEWLADLTVFASSEHLQHIDVGTMVGMAEKIAVLNKAANESRLEQERLKAANLAFEQAARPREISSILVAWDKQGLELMKEMTAFPGTLLFIQTVPEFEAQNFAHAIELLCHNSLHWRVKTLSEAQTGVSPFAMEGIELWTNGPEPPRQARGSDDRAWQATEALVKYLYSYDVYAVHEDLSVEKRIKVKGRNLLTPGHFRLPPGGILMFVGTRRVSSDAEINFSRLEQSAQ